MRLHPFAAIGNSTQGRSQFQWRNGDRTLPDAHRDRFARIPLLAGQTELPFGGGHCALTLVRQVDASLAPYASNISVFSQTIDAQLIGNVIEENVTTFPQRAMQRNI